MTRRELELERLARHEAWISRPPRELFPNDGPKVDVVCRHCGKVFQRNVSNGNTKKGFCSERCRAVWADLKAGRGEVRRSKRSPRLPGFKEAG